MLGAIIGDIVGSIYEFHNHRSKDFPLFSDRCFFTDDTVMTLAVAASLMMGTQDDQVLFKNTVENMQMIGRRYPDAGYGGRFNAWLYLKNPQPYNSFGNGAGMRVSSVGYVGQSLTEVKRLSNIVSSTTHNHPEGLKAAEAIAIAVFMARNGSTKEQIIKVMKTYYPLNYQLEALRQTYQFNETSQETTPQAIFAFIESTDFEDAIRTAISIGGDSDTLAAMTGAMAGAYYGIPKSIAQKALSFLDQPLLTLYQRFTTAYPPSIIQ